MKLSRTVGRVATIGLLTFALAGCASHYDRKTSNTLLGAGLGGAAGAVASGGNPLYTIGGAAAGGVLGNILTEDRDRGDRRARDRDRGRDYKSSRWNRDDRSSRRYRDDRRDHDRRR